MPDQEFFGKSLEDIAKERQREHKEASKAARKAKEKEDADLKKRRDYEATLAQQTREIRAGIPPGTNIVSPALQALVKLDDFERIRREFLSLPDVPYKIKYIARVMYERLPKYAQCTTQNPPFFYHRLAELGMPLLCPYLKLEKANTTTHEDCTIDSEQEPTMALCGGRYDSCVIFKDRTMKAVQGFVKLRLPDVKVQHPVQQKCLVDLEDLDDWWLMEGKYE